MSEQNVNTNEDFMAHIADILIILADVSNGDYSRRLKMDMPDTNPFGALIQGINQMVDSFESEQQRSFVSQSVLEEKLAMIEQQRAAIRELSTPIMEVWDRVLCLPVVGVLDSTRSSEMTEQLLRSIIEKKAKCAIIDITGIEVMDTLTADHFLRMAKAVKLLGAECLLTGINPGIAQTIVHMGVDLSSIVTFRSLRDALHQYVNTSLSADFGSS